ncbi:hypothetical protein Y032_0067g10 [Ancylostoma ceylanicum]|uniref:Uncharacterized protein n=1 Tax=Ancylostoma ceylanicum TaxID=53326 RepID=A0A016TZT1_9BILA|nr:hypothetical protein Y032_0067g10 [Ancylostoma ceylanicum]
MGKKTPTNNNNNNGSEKRSIDDLKEEAKQLVTKIQNHFLAIEEHRRKDRELWRSLNRRIECLEEVKSQRGKRRRVRREDKAMPMAHTPGSVKAAQ